MGVKKLNQILNREKKKNTDTENILALIIVQEDGMQTFLVTFLPCFILFHFALFSLFNINFFFIFIRFIFNLQFGMSFFFFKLFCCFWGRKQGTEETLNRIFQNRFYFSKITFLYFFYIDKRIILYQL